MRALIVAAAFVAASLSSGASAQVQSQDATVSTGVVVVPSPPANASPAAAAPAPATIPFASATVRSLTLQPVCETRREQFADETGWRVRDVRVCN
jgi:hypothetical protein